MTIESAGVPVVAFVGRSGSGKTTLLAQVISELARLGVRVAAIKHAPGHDIVTDVEGSDSYRFWASGASSVVLVGRDRVVETRRHAENWRWRRHRRPRSRDQCCWRVTAEHYNKHRGGSCGM